MSLSTKILLKPCIQSMHPWSRPNGHQNRFRTTITTSRSIYEVMPLTNEYLLQEIFYTACGSTAWWLKRAQASLNLLSITIISEAHLLDINECDAKIQHCRIWLMITDGYEWCRQGKHPSTPSHERKLYHADDSDQEPRRDTNHMCGTGWHIGCQRSWKVEIWRYWGLGLGSRENWWEEFRNSAPEESNQSGIAFFCSFSSILHMLLHYSISAQYKCRWRWFLPPLDRSQVEVEFPHAPDLPKGHPEKYWSVVRLVSLYEHVYGMMV